jgi:hypothetical protein
MLHKHKLEVFEFYFLLIISKRVSNKKLYEHEWYMNLILQKKIVEWENR